MKVKIGILFAALVVLGNLLYFHIVDQMSKYTMVQCLLLTLMLYILGDFIGYFVLRLPLHKYTNLLTYFSKEILGQAGYIAAFSFVWAALVAFCNLWFANNTIIEAIVKGGLIPGLYYMIMHMYSYSKTERDVQLLKRKL